MGEYFKLCCLDCKEATYLGKLSEPDFKKLQNILEFFNRHLLHKLEVIGDEFNKDIFVDDENYQIFYSKQQEEIERLTATNNAMRTVMMANFVEKLKREIKKEVKV